MLNSIHASSKTAVEAHKPQRTSMEQKRGKGNGAFLNAFTFTNKTHSRTGICLKLHLKVGAFLRACKVRPSYGI